MIVEDIVPRNICDRKKKGFTPPIGDWILQDVYQLEIIECVQYLNEMKLISIEWLNVFNSLSKQSNDAYSLEYQTRILLFHYWYIKWIL